MPDLDETFADVPGARPDGHVRAPVTAAQFAALPAPEVPSGYVVCVVSDGSERRFRIRLERGRNWTGKRTVARHCVIAAPVPGAKPTEDWETVGIVGPSGFELLPRYRHDTYLPRQLSALWSLLHAEPAPGYSIAELDRRCVVTMRALVDEDGRRIGVCKTWRKRLSLT